VCKNVPDPTAFFLSFPSACIDKEPKIMGAFKLPSSEPEFGVEVEAEALVDASMVETDTAELSISRYELTLRDLRADATLVVTTSRSLSVGTSQLNSIIAGVCPARKQLQQRQQQQQQQQNTAIIIAKIAVKQLVSTLNHTLMSFNSLFRFQFEIGSNTATT
jgi:hypothetical protein